MPAPCARSTTILKAERSEGASAIASTWRLIMGSIICISVAISVSFAGPSQTILTLCFQALLTAPACTLCQKMSALALGITATVVTCCRLQLTDASAAAKHAAARRHETRRAELDLISSEKQCNLVWSVWDVWERTWCGDCKKAATHASYST